MKISHSAQKAVSPVIGVILMVAITIVLAAVVYVWVIRYSLEERIPTGVFSFKQQTVPGGATHYSGMVYIFENKKVRLSDIQVLVNTKIDDEDRYGMGDLDGFSGTTGIAGEWHFNSGNGNIAYDSSGNENDGTIHGAAWTNGMSGSALSFNGSDDYVNVPYAANLDITDAITIELWMKPTSFHSSWNYLMFQTNYKLEFGFYGSSISEEPRFKPKNSAGATFEVEGDALTTGQWYHVAGVRDGSFVGIYVNGILKESRNDFTGDLKSGGNVQIGGEGNNNGLNSTIDEVRIYNRALTADEAKVHAGGLAVFFQDADGDNMLSSLDVFTVRGAEPGDKISLIYKPTGGLVASHIF